MKKSILLSAASLLTIFTACEELGQGGHETKELNPDEQKVKLENVGRKLMTLYSAENFDEFFELAEYVKDTYFAEGYDHTEIVNRIEECGDNILEFKGEKSEDVKDDNDNSHIENTKFYILAASLSECTGDFDFGAKAVTYKESDGTRFTFKDQNGTDCIMELAGSGKETTIRMDGLRIYDNHESIYDDDGNYCGHIEHYREYDATLTIPEKVVLNLKRGSEVVAGLELTFRFNVREGQTVDLGKDGADISTKLTVGEYVFSVDRVSYNPGTAEVRYNMSRGGTSLITLAASGAVAFRNEVSNVGCDYAKDLEGSLDILGEVQIKATCRDLEQLVSAVDRFYDSEDKSELDAINSLYTANVYYDGGSNSQAEFKMIAEVCRHEAEDYNGDGIIDSPEYEHLALEPAFQFPDGASYSFVSFFDEGEFKGLIDVFRQFCDDFAKYFAVYFPEDSL